MIKCIRYRTTVNLFFVFINSAIEIIILEHNFKRTVKWVFTVDFAGFKPRNFKVKIKLVMKGQKLFLRVDED